MSVKFSPNALEQVFDLARNDRVKLRELKKVINDTQRNGTDGIGQPEELTGDSAGWWSKRLNKKDRMVFRILDDEVEVVDCCSHYGNK